ADAQDQGPPRERLHHGGQSQRARGKSLTAGPPERRSAAMRGAILMFACIVAVPGLATATDVPVAGHRLSLRANAAQPAWRGARILAADPALAPPFADPTTGAA